MSDIAEVLRLTKESAAATAEFNEKQIKRIDAAEESRKMIEDFMAKATSPFAGTSASKAVESTEQWIDTKSGKPIVALKPGDSLAAIQGKSSDAPSLGRVLRGLVCGSNASDHAELSDERKSMNIGNDPSGGYTVEGQIAAEWIDRLRSQSVLTRAGARTIAMPTGQLAIARVTGDPIVTWHGESADVPDANPTFGRVTLSAKTAVCKVRYSLELSQDSANLEEQLAGVVTRAMGAALDSAGLIGTSTNALAAPAGLLGLAGRNSVTGVGAPADNDFLIDAVAELLADNADMATIGALVGHPLLWKALAKLRTGITSDATPLQAPAEIARLPRLWTTAIPSTTAIIANWSDVIIGLRQSLTIKLLDSHLASNLDGTLLAYMRADVQCVRPDSICTLEDITV